MRFNNIQVLRLVTAVGVVLAHTGYYGGHLFGVCGPVVDWLWSPTWINFLAPTFFAVSMISAAGSIHHLNNSSDVTVKNARDLPSRAPFSSN